MSSDTPRTDAIWLANHQPEEMALHLLSNSKDLERELTAAQARIAELEAQAKADAEDAARLEELDKANTKLAAESSFLRGLLSSLVKAIDAMGDMDEMDGAEYEEASRNLEAAIKAAMPHTEWALLQAAIDAEDAAAWRSVQEQYEIFRDDYDKYASGDLKFPFSELRVSIAAFFQVFQAAIDAARERGNG